MGGLGTALLDLCSLYWFDQMVFAEQAGTKKARGLGKVCAVCMYVVLYCSVFGERWKKSREGPI